MERFKQIRHWIVAASIGAFFGIIYLLQTTYPAHFGPGLPSPPSLIMGTGALPSLQSKLITDEFDLYWLKILLNEGFEFALRGAILGVLLLFGWERLGKKVFRVPQIPTRYFISGFLGLLGGLVINMIWGHPSLESLHYHLWDWNSLIGQVVCGCAFALIHDQLQLLKRGVQLGRLPLLPIALLIAAVGCASLLLSFGNVVWPCHSFAAFVSPDDWSRFGIPAAYLMVWAVFFAYLICTLCALMEVARYLFRNRTKSESAT